MAYNLFPWQKKLVSQAQNKFKQGKKSVLIVSPAGSGKSVIIADIVRRTVEKGGHVLFMVHRKELVDQITETVSNNDVDLNKCTILTVGKIANRLEKLPKPTLIITDETHHSLAATYKKIYDYYSGIPKMGFSATPWRLNGEGLGDVYDCMVTGPNVQWLIDHHYLAPYKYYSVKLINDDKLKKSSTGEYTSNSMEESIKPAFYGDVVHTYRKKAKGTQAIVYAPSVKLSKKIADEFSSNGIVACHADAKTPKKERDHIMNGFKDGKIKVICNVDLISEGFNVPDCKTVIMCRPTQSLVLDVQQSMRSMRYKPNKTAIIIDHVANYQRWGLPNTERHWTLSDRAKKSNKKKSDAGSIRQCPECMGIIEGTPKICPYCGFRFEETNQRKWDKSKELEEIHNDDFHLTVNYAATKDWHKAKSKQELDEIADAKGYKRGWSFYKAKQLNLIK